MNKNTILSSVIFLLVVGVVVFGIIHYRKSKETYLSDTGLVVIGKAPSFSFTDQNGKIITNQTYEGKIYVVDFFFTTCPTICPIMTTNMARVQDAFPDNSIGIASFSINPTTDTPEVLLQYAKKFGVTNPHWHLLTGDEKKIFKLSNEGFNIYAAKIDDEQEGFEHSGLFALIDQKGNIVSRKNDKGQPIIYYKGTESEGIQMLIEDIKKLQK
ncbi:SCO family protein [Capnocytophaga catalasegens]|uniref:Photosynthetic protein synthase II n=1 Tax=Capnocytophaga catalasegens TaxID=1004260 RepID=A0AAV5AZD2_9FLAO|nr:SCO family protein [Capnocytophaga catalasegens]GIZ14353.1 photosynthetic protein synthase II [Capnocytophaga catalasegens]GJM51350.1 photosynthetic protein synthase II [Capnocytophaga catalasegens]GJM53233.1 photosynthetic protein synthase II [Capnocytophaga catalasegens]